MFSCARIDITGACLCNQMQKEPARCLQIDYADTLIRTVYCRDVSRRPIHWDWLKSIDIGGQWCIVLCISPVKVCIRFDLASRPHLSPYGLAFAAKCGSELSRS